MNAALKVDSQGYGELLQRIATDSTGELWLRLELKPLVAWVDLDFVLKDDTQSKVLPRWTLVSGKPELMETVRRMMKEFETPGTITDGLKKLRAPAAHRNFILATD